MNPTTSTFLVLLFNFSANHHPLCYLLITIPFVREPFHTIPAEEEEYIQDSPALGGEQRFIHMKLSCFNFQFFIIIMYCYISLYFFALRFPAILIPFSVHCPLLSSFAFTLHLHLSLFRPHDRHKSREEAHVFCSLPAVHPVWKAS